MQRQGVIERYKSYLPVSEETPIISLLEGSTPLIYAKNISEILGNGIRLYLKYEGLNPSGSFKDRGMTMAISKACEAGSVATICASTGNTSASAAAYCASAKIKSYVIIPKGSIAMGKLAQAIIHGAKVFAVKGNFDDALNLVKKIAGEYPVTLVNSLNPYRIEGQKSGAFEICDELEGSPDIHVIPVGNAGNITAYWKGYKEYLEKGKIHKLPRMFGFQAKGASPIVEDRIFEKPETIATAIRIGNPASWKQAVAARDESGGLIEACSDEEILEAYKLLTQKEGVFAEPASAITIAGLLKLKRENRLPKDVTISATLTGHGLKDPDCAINNSLKPEIIENDYEQLKRIIDADI
ncbi:MAG: threonine synthase [Pseudomonadota bacterium]